MDSLLKEVLNRIKPSEEERGRVRSIVEKVVERAKRKAEEVGVEAEVEVEGSIAKDTWLSGDKDIDIFIILPKDLGLGGLRTVGLEIAKGAAGERWIESYAEHPYVEARVEGYRVDIVPCLKVDRPDARISAVDRTPFHTRYVLSKIDEGKRDEVRLLKKFMKGIDVYGAEMRVGGFSGYLVELLVIEYGSFLNVVEEASRWGERRLIDIEKYYDAEDAMAIFKEPLVVVDPVDKRRNVAAALTSEKYFEFIAASRAFLKKPAMSFFFPQESAIGKFDDAMALVRDRGTHLLVLYASCPRLPAEVLWGQLTKSLSGVGKLLEGEGFSVLYAKPWSDEENYVALAFELDKDKLAKTYLRKGPPVHMAEDESSFLSKYLGCCDEVAAGPWIHKNRWVVLLRRRLNALKDVLRERISKASLGKHFLAEFRRSGRVLVDEEVAEVFERHDDFKLFLTRFLRKRPPWLK